MSMGVNRRHFTLGAAGLAASTLIVPAWAQSTTRSITTSLGTYDIPTDPQRVVVIDTRLDLEPAVALGLRVIAYSYIQDIEPWVPFAGSEINVLLGVGSPQVTAIGQVLDDLGGTSVGYEGLGEYGNVSFELMGDVLADVEVLVVDNSEAGALEALEASQVWGRLPAVLAKRVLLSSGVYYGGGYTAKHLIGEWDKAYSMLEG